MNFLIANAWADGAGAAASGAAGGGLLGLVVPMALVAVFFYFFIARPQSRRAKEHKAMIDALAKGDEVSIAGILGKITQVSENFVTVEIADGVVIKVQRHTIQTILPKGTVKSA